MAARGQTLFTGVGVHLWRQQDMNYIRPRFPQHGFQTPEDGRNPIFLLHDLRAIQVDVADGDGLNEFGNTPKGWGMTVGYISCAKKSDAESPVWPCLT